MADMNDIPMMRVKKEFILDLKDPKCPQCEGTLLYFGVYKNEGKKLLNYFCFKCMECLCFEAPTAEQYIHFPYRE